MSKPVRLLTPGQQKRDARLDFCAAVHAHQIIHDFLPAREAYQAVADQRSGVFPTCHAFEVFLSRNREAVRSRIVEIASETADLAPVAPIERGGDRCGLQTVDKASLDRFATNEDEEFVRRAVMGIVSSPAATDRMMSEIRATPLLLKSITRDYVIRKYT